MSLARNRARARWLPGSAFAVLAATGLPACSAGHHSPSASSTPPTPTARPTQAAQVADLPGRNSPGTGPGYQTITSARGTGSRSLGTFAIKSNGETYIQISCYGPPPLTVVGVLDLGPCGGGGLISTDTTELNQREFTITIKTSPRMQWAIYVSQAK